MGTRGLYGIRKNGRDKATYNHWDSYPDYLGREVAKFCASRTLEELNTLFDNIELVDEMSQPTEDQKKRCVDAGWYDGSVSEQSTDDWYCLLRKLQGNFDELRKFTSGEEKIYMNDGISFIRNSLFCEYAYIINLDTGKLEFYVGFQHGAQHGNRYGEEPKDNGYYPCRLALEIPLVDIADVDRVVAMMNKYD